MASFQGAYPYGTPGGLSATTGGIDASDTDSSTQRIAEGIGFRAWLTVDGPFYSKDKRAVWGATRVLGPDGSGTIPTSQTGSMTLIFKKDGAVLEANAVELDLLSTMFNLSTASQVVSITGFATDAITAAHIAAGAVGTSELAAGAVTEAKLAAASVGTAELIDGAITYAKLAAAMIGSGSSQVANGAHTHATGGIKSASAVAGYSSHSVSTTLTTIVSATLGPLTSGIVYDIWCIALGQFNAPASGFIRSYARIAGDASVLGMQVGTASGERPCMAFSTKSGVTGDGVTTYTCSLRADTDTGTGSVADGIVVAVAIPRS